MQIPFTPQNLYDKLTITPAVFCRKDYFFYSHRVVMRDLQSCRAVAQNKGGL